MERYTTNKTTMRGVVEMVVGHEGYKERSLPLYLVLLFFVINVIVIYRVYLCESASNSSTSLVYVLSSALHPILCSTRP